MLSLCTVRHRSRKNVVNSMDELNAASALGNQSDGVEQTTQAGSAPVEQAGDNAPVESEKTETTQEQEAGVEETQEQRIPYERFQQKVAEVNQFKEAMAQKEQELETYRNLVSAVQQNPNVANLLAQNQANPEIEEAKKVLTDLGYVAKDDVQGMIEKAMEQREAQREFVTKMTDLEGKYNGKGGEPKFVPEEIAKYMDETGIPDPEKAYREKYLDQLIDIKAKQARSSTFSEKPGQPMQTVSTDNNAAFEEAKQKRDFTGYLESLLTSKRI